jgi:hypothetical protein
MPHLQLHELEEEQEGQCSVGVSPFAVDGLGAVLSMRTEVFAVWPVARQEDFSSRRPVPDGGVRRAILAVSGRR